MDHLEAVAEQPVKFLARYITAALDEFAVRTFGNVADDLHPIGWIGQAEADGGTSKNGLDEGVIPGIAAAKPILTEKPNVSLTSNRFVLDLRDGIHCR